MSVWYLVTSPEYDYVEVVIPETGQGPTHPTRDVAVIKAPTAQAAKWAAARLWQANATPSWDCWPAIARRDGRHPLSGVKAERWDHYPMEGDPERSVDPDPTSWRPFYAEVPA